MEEKTLKVLDEHMVFPVSLHSVLVECLILHLIQYCIIDHINPVWGAWLDVAWLENRQFLVANEQSFDHKMYYIKIHVKHFRGCASTWSTCGCYSPDVGTNYTFHSTSYISVQNYSICICLA